MHRWADATVMPWRNGGGTTTEVARRAAADDLTGDGFDWRVSVADVAADGPFSCFHGIDRILVLLDGAGMDLRIAAGNADLDAAVVQLRPPYGHHRFAGEADIHAALVDGPTTDLNLMWRRDRWEASVDWLETPCRIDPVDAAGDVVEGALLLAVVVDGAARLPAGELLGKGDVVERTGSLLFAGDASLIVFTLRPVGADGP